MPEKYNFFLQKDFLRLIKSPGLRSVTTLGLGFALSNIGSVSCEMLLQTENAEKFQIAWSCLAFTCVVLIMVIGFQFWNERERLVPDDKSNSENKSEAALALPTPNPEHLSVPNDRQAEQTKIENTEQDQ
ncbi:MAG: hypothetical protein AAGB13_07410 [Cyanobacteria bacterium P01_F01_bin.33]